MFMEILVGYINTRTIIFWANHLNGMMSVLSAIVEGMSFFECSTRSFQRHNDNLSLRITIVYDCILFHLMKIANKRCQY